MMRALFLFLAGIAFSSVISQVNADERILDYHSDILVHIDGSMTVTEIIRVRAEGNRIRRGIYRDFPMRYRDRHGNRVTVDFKVLAAVRNGEAEPYHLEGRSNGVRVYLGSAGRTISEGEHEYALTYHTDHQLGHFGDRDELYWNVTGNGWDFEIDHATATVSLPGGIDADAIGTEAYTGEYGSREKAATSHVDAGGAVYFETARPLRPGEGLTIVVDWPAGVVQRPTAGERVNRFFTDNVGALVLGAGLLLVFLYYFLTWRRVGVDPQGGPVFPQYAPPEKLSPAAARYVIKMGADNKAFSAAIVSMAVKGYLRIVETDGDYRLEKQPDADISRLSSGEHRAAAVLFRSGNSIELENSNHATVSKARSKLKEALKLEYGSGFFRHNSGYFGFGLLVSLVAAIIGASQAPGDPAAAIFLTIWLMIWTGVVMFLLLSRHYLMFVMFGIFEVAAGFAFHELVGLAHLVMLVALAAINVLFFHLLKAPTSMGRKLMDRIEGFGLYLSVAEGERLRKLDPSGEPPPASSVELFERFLPYAIALDVEQDWADQFAETLQDAARDGSYHPRWYSGDGWNIHRPARFSHSLGSAFAGAISSAATAPGSSSGSGGGGFSGGGGGGGGGGGW